MSTPPTNTPPMLHRLNRGNLAAATFDNDILRIVGNQQKWHTLSPERSEVRWRSGKLPEGHVVLSSPFNCLSLYLPPAL